MTFTAPLFLLGLLAVAIPIVVHLFNFRRYKKVYFSNVEQLEQLQTEQRRQSTLRQLLILAARILAIVFLVLAFARPVLSPREGSLSVGGTDVSIFIDNSFSMESTDGSVALIEKAKTKAREIVAAYGTTDRFQLLTCDAEGHQFHWLSREDMIAAIDDVEISPTTMTASSAARRQYDFLKSGGARNRHAYLISDFQTSMADMDNLLTDSTVNTTFVPLEAGAQNNVFIDSIAFDAPVFYKGNSVTAEVWLHNDGDENLEKVPVTLYAGGRQRAVASVDLAARSSTSVDMHFTIEENGVLQGRVEAADYPVTFDDSYYFTLNIRDHINLLVVEGVQTNEYLQRLFSDDDAVNYNAVSIKQMDFSRIDGNDVVILDELPQISTGMAQTLRSFAENGGTVVVVAGDKVDENSYNEALQLFSAPTLGGVNKGRVSANMVHYDNSLYRNVFAKANNDDMEMPSVADYYRLSATSATLREPVITLASGDDYIVATPCGDGRLYLVAAPLRDAHTDFVRQALFVPTFYNMALYSVRPTRPAVSFGDESPVPLGNAYDMSSGSVKMVAADVSSSAVVPEFIPDIRSIGGSSYLVPHGSPDKAGNYLLQQDGVTVEGVSFNYSRSESLMQFLGAAGVERVLKDFNQKNVSVVRNVDKPLDSYLRQRMEGRPLWRWCVVACLLTLLAETVLIVSNKRR